MEYFYKQLDESGGVEVLLTYPKQYRGSNPRITQITEVEYNSLLAEIMANVPEGVAPGDEDELSDEEAFAILTGGTL